MCGGTSTVHYKLRKRIMFFINSSIWIENKYRQLTTNIMNIESLREISQIAKDYTKTCNENIQRNRHMNEIEEGEIIQQRHIEAVIVDFVNYMAYQNAHDWGMYTKDLK